MPVLFRLFLLLICATTLHAQRNSEDWDYPWPKGYVLLTQQIDKETIDGYDARRLIWTAPGLSMGLPLSADWNFKEATTSSFRLSYRYSDKVSCTFYCYPEDAFNLSNDPDAFHAYLETIVENAAEAKDAAVEFIRNDEGVIVTEPERIVNKRSVRYNPDSKDPQGTMPRILGQYFYEVRYMCMRKGEPRSGALLYIFVEGFTITAQLECSPGDFPRCEERLIDLLRRAYLISDTEDAL